MSLPVLIKAGFGVLTAILYGVAGLIMINGAIGTPGYAPGEGVEYVITLFGAAVTAFVAAQLGIALGAAATQDGQDQNLVARLDRDPESNGKVTAGILLVDVLVLVVIGGLFLWLYMDPGSIEVKEGQKALSSAPDYISLQAKAFIALVVAGAGGVGVAAAK